jgi:hypothetical protein
MDINSAINPEAARPDPAKRDFGLKGTRQME